jgi:uncharacterized protein YybS (DUF2232 family)
MGKDIITGVLVEILLFAASAVIPVVGSFCSIVMPLPVLYYRVKLGRRMGLLVPAISLFVLAAVIGEPSLNMLGFVEFLLIGYLLGEMIEQRTSVERTVLATCAGAVAAGFVGMLLLSALAGTGLIETLNRYVSENIRVTVEIYRQMGMPEDSVRQISDSLSGIQRHIVAAIPALIIASTLLITWFNLLWARALLVRRGMWPMHFGALNRWKAPDQLVWAVIASAVLALLPGQAATWMGLNGLLILIPVYLFQGLAIISFFFEKKGVPQGLRVVLYVIVVLQQVLLIAVIGIGFVDVWLNIRRIGREAP